MLTWLLALAVLNIISGLLTGVHAVINRMTPEPYGSEGAPARCWCAWWCAGLATALPACGWLAADRLVLWHQ